MQRISHVAIATQDPEGTAKFYNEGLGLVEVGKVDSALAEGYYLSDGYINLAILASTT
ncbi:MAG: VOC family protein [Chloroflexi bacterium]|nr:VOC family protein [Chloroflexota bacterium]